MKLNYELNPPKIENEGSVNLQVLNERMNTFQKRAGQLIGLVDGIHITDSVLGIPRISSIVAASLLSMNRILDTISVTCSLRIRDRTLISISQFIADALLLGIKGILLVAGDNSSNSSKYSKKSSDLVRELRKMRYDEHIELDLAIPNQITKVALVQNKIEAKPDAFITQSIDSLESLKGIVEISHQNEIKVIACIMIPCQKNEASAKTIGLDWASYRSAPTDFIKEAGRIADEVLLTSPNSFDAGLDLLHQLRS